jgi:hypothetical protein
MPDRCSARTLQTVQAIDPAVRSVLDGLPVGIRTRLLDMRRLIFETAQGTGGVGEMCETLKWGDPAYLPQAPRIGTTIRMNALRGSAEQYALFFNCRTTLVETFRELYPAELRFDGKRAILFNVQDEIPAPAVGHCIALALTYHLTSRAGR